MSHLSHGDKDFDEVVENESFSQSAGDALMQEYASARK